MSDEKKEKTVKEMLEEELNSRFEIIESPDYERVEGFKKIDFVGIAVVAVLAIVVMLIGIL